MAEAAENRPLTSVRGFAAVWVVGHHWLVNGPQWTQSAFRAGYTAVDLFFILSGLILTSVYADLHVSGVRRFWLRRAMRLYPLHVVALLALLLIVTYPAWTPATVRSINWLAFLSSVLLVYPLLNLTPIANPPAWSIGIELICYAAFPVALVLFRSYRSKTVSLVLIACLVAAEGLALRHYADATHGVGAALRGLAGFALGMALCRFGEDLRGRLALTSLGEACGLAGIVAAAWMYQPSLIPLFSALLLFSLSFDTGVVARLLRLPVCVWLGRISFSIYLLHYPLIVAADRWWPAASWPGGQSLRWCVLLALLLVLSTMTYRYVEQPGRRLFRNSRPRAQPLSRNAASLPRL